MIGSFWFDGINSKDRGIYVSGSGTFDSPEPDIEKIEVPGKSGDLLVDKNRYKNVSLTYPAFIRTQFRELTDLTRQWLLSPKGYRRLEDTYHPDEYRKARFSGPINFDVRFLNLSGECDLVFDCKPQRYLKIGENTIKASGKLELYNPTEFQAEPLIRVYGTSGVLYVGEQMVRINAIDGYVDLDSETQNAFKGTVNCNSNIVRTDLPTLPAGKTGIRTEGNITGYEITPRWWRI